MTPPASSPAIRIVKSVREQVSAEEWQTRVDLAACYRLTALYGMTEMMPTTSPAGFRDRPVIS